jgi:NAD(P)-dependent dehydrogenase (short-subunit alcohol dehydrogenase family)
VPGVDLASEEAVSGYFSTLPELWASIHCAGGFSPSAIERTSAEQLQAMWTTNALTAALCCREAVGRMGGAGGRLVNVAARPALDPAEGAGMVAYAMSKGAVAMLTRALSRELASRRILVNAVAPSILDTPANRQAMPDADHDGWPSVKQVARVVGFLASPFNEVTSGAVLPVYGRSPL